MWKDQQVQFLGGERQSTFEKLQVSPFDQKCRFYLKAVGNSAEFLKVSRFYFLNCFRFIAKWSRRYRDFPVTHSPTYTYLFPLSNPYQSGTFVTVVPTLTHHYHPKSQFTLEFSLKDIHSVAFDKCIMTYIHIISSYRILLSFLN